MIRLRVFILLLHVCDLLGVSAFVQTETTLEIVVDFNPCDWKECRVDEDCRVIDHSELLEIPVGACVKKNIRPTEAGNCKALKIATNILNCKTALEWVEIGQVQCTVEELEFDQRSLKTKYICHQKVGEEYKYLSAEFSCCQTETPSVLTVATPDTTMLSGRFNKDDWTSATDVEEEHRSDDFPMETYESAVDNMPTTEVDIDQQLVKDDNEDADDNHGRDDKNTYVNNDDDDDNNESIVVFLIVFGLFSCVVILFGIGAYARFISKKHSGGYKGLPTVLVNPHCDDFKVVYEVPDYPVKQPYL